MQTPLTPLQPLGTYLSDKPEVKFIEMTREKLTTIIQTAMARAGKPARELSALYKQQISEIEAEIADTRLQTLQVLEQRLAALKP